MVVNAGVGLVGLTCQRTGVYRPPGAKGDGEDPNQHFRAADFPLLHDECSHRHSLDGLHLHISAAANLSDSWVGVENVIKAVFPGFYSPFKESSQETFSLLRGAAAAVFLCCCC